MAARKQVARGHGDIPTENKPKPRQSARNPQASAPTQRAASKSKSAALSIGGGDKVTKVTPQKARRVYTDDELIEQFYKHNGLIARAAAALDCSRKMIYERCDANPALQAELDNARRHAVDFAEDALHARITDGDTTAIIFLLKTLGKTRGYVERQEFTGASGGAIEQRVTVIYEGDGEND